VPSKLATVIQQNRPFDSPQQEAGLLIARIGSDLRRAFETVLKPHGITQTHYNVLRILRGARSAGLPCSALGERLVEHAPDTTRLLDRLVRLRLVARRRDRDDRRIVRSFITPAGLELLDTLTDPLARLQNDLFGHMTTERLQLLVALLDELYLPDR
jgi:DNA-binding MarR family transcriptional regulator